MPRAHRVVAFVAIASGDADYTRTSPAVRPHWALTADAPQPEQSPVAPRPAAPTCGRCGEGATRDKGLVPCFGCGNTPLCRVHAAAPCAACEVSPGPVDRGMLQSRAVVVTGVQFLAIGLGRQPSHTAARPHLLVKRGINTCSQATTQRFQHGAAGLVPPGRHRLAPRRWSSTPSRSPPALPAGRHGSRVRTCPLGA